MARQHGGGYINEDAYWNIGTDAQRGRDGDTARDAARKYNDHKHPAAVIVDVGDLHSWANEPQLASAGGYLADNAAEYARSPGDLAIYGGRLYVSDGAGDVLPLGGVGAHIVVDSGGSPSLVSDRIETVQQIASGSSYAVGALGEEESVAIGSVLLRPGAVYVHNAARSTRVRVTGALQLRDPQLLDFALTVGGVQLAPFVYITATISATTDGFTPSGIDGDTFAETSTLLGLTGDVSESMLAARGLATPSWHTSDVAGSTANVGVLTLRATLSTLEHMCAAAGVSSELITPVNRELWQARRADCILQVIDAHVTTALVFGG